MSPTYADAWRACVERLGADEQFAYWLELVEQLGPRTRGELLAEMAEALARRAPLDARARAWLERVRARLELS